MFPRTLPKELRPFWEQKILRGGPYVDAVPKLAEPKRGLVDEVLARQERTADERFRMAIRRPAVVQPRLRGCCILVREGTR